MYRKQYEEFCILILGCKGLRGKPVGFFINRQGVVLGITEKKNWSGGQCCQCYQVGENLMDTLSNNYILLQIKN